MPISCQGTPPCGWWCRETARQKRDLTALRSKKRSVSQQLCFRAQKLKGLQDKMHFHFLVSLLLFLHDAESQGNTRIPQKLAQRRASPGETLRISCILPYGVYTRGVTWYKEDQDRSLHIINQSYEDMTAGQNFPGQVILTLRNVQRKDSGVYYCCATNTKEGFRILNGSRLIVRGERSSTFGKRLVFSECLFDASGSSASILAPSFLEGTQLSHHIPLLCFFYDGHPDQDTVSWDIHGKTFEQQDGDMIDGEGAFSIWSLQLMPPEFWTEGMSYSCSDQENRNLSAVVPTNTVPTNTGSCRPILYIGLPCIAALLLISAWVLLFSKHLGKGDGEKLDAQIPIEETPQIDYAEVHWKN
ncbi:uncharacterized protein LOC128337497 isoform X3 [Hemicordylus capensis]|uniref:uncharacterized protein LOC128337497 isoform X3 n=1 Tax=Hemicordylus capensis TaxID=884348 RepID=UPI0023040F56|nr:uncharacterized protein LOC128337497 isoform X3 [Hemicordylus capensis]